MRLSVKARYGLSAMICLARNYSSGRYTTIISLSEKLNVSKIYLEQVFSLLKRAALVASAKGAQGGYSLTRLPIEITVFDVLSAIETALFEKTEETVSESYPAMEKTMKIKVYDQLDANVMETLSGVTLEDLAAELEAQIADDEYMYYL